MHYQRPVQRVAQLLVFLTIVLLLPPAARAESRYEVLYGFTGGNDGGGSWASLTRDKMGNLYSTTSGGGKYGYGTVFKLKRLPGGGWAEKVLHSFQHGGPEGQEPSDPVVFDENGNLYGTASLGGERGFGTVYELAPGLAGWISTVLYSFCSQPNCSDGGVPHGGVAFDAKGNLYGTAFNVFQLTPGPKGWIENVLHEFCTQPCSDGYQPLSGVILGAKGNLFGTTLSGGIYGAGTVFKVRPMPDGTWKERVLHSFGAFPHDGRGPGVGALALDAAGSLYGTTGSGGKNVCGTYYCGTIFRLTPQPNGQWKETILYHFKKGSTGNGPGAGVVIDGAGNLYGTTLYGGTQCDCGVVYKLAPNPDGTWSYSVLHQFTGYDGADPDANLILDDQGNLYGTTAIGGPGGAGVVFKLTP